MSRRNFGYGRRLDYAGKRVLTEHFGRGHHGSQRTQGERWQRISGWLRAEHGINDMRDIRPAHIRAWTDERLENGYAQRTVRDEISAANVVMHHASRGAWQRIAPKTIIGPRNDVRGTAPKSVDHSVDRHARAALDARPRAAAVWGLARETGMRSEEAALADLDRLAREANRYGAINIQDGAKGGRSTPRWVPVTARGREALNAARAARPAHSRNLLRTQETYTQWRNGALRSGRDALHAAGVLGYHDARAAYACDRYQTLTSHKAPVCTDRRLADRSADRQARVQIAYELGHGRISVVAAYVGSAK